jgi:hypothetical protein
VLGREPSTLSRARVFGARRSALGAGRTARIQRTGP